MGRVPFTQQRYQQQQQHQQKVMNNLKLVVVNGEVDQILAVSD